jgi:hypothetical protein
MISVRTRLFYATLIATMLFALWFISPFYGWLHTIVKLEPMRLPYTIGFFLVLFTVLVLMPEWATRHRWVIVVGVGACIGQVIAFASFFVAGLFIPNGIERMIKTFERLDAVGLLAVDFVIAASLGGWLLGAIAFSVLKALISRRGAGPTRLQSGS